MSMFKYSVKACFRGEWIPFWIFCWVFRASLKTQTFCVLGAPGEQDLAVLSSLVLYPSGKTCVLEHFGRVTVSWNWVWAVDIEQQVSAVVAWPMPAERGSLTHSWDQGQWAPVVYYQTLLSAFPPWIYCHCDTCVLPTMLLFTLWSLSYSVLLDLMFVFWNSFSGW